MMRSVSLDMRNGGREIVDHLHRDDGIEIFGSPVLLGGRLDALVCGQCCSVAADFAAGFGQPIYERLEMRRRAGAIDEQGFRRSANTRSTHLGVQHDFFCHVERRRTMNEYVADAFKVRKYGYPCLDLNPSDEALSAARHDHVDIAVETLQHQANCGAVARRDKLD